MYPSSVGSSGRVNLLFLFIIILSILLPPLVSNVTIIVSLISSLISFLGHEYLTFFTTVLVLPS